MADQVEVAMDQIMVRAMMVMQINLSNRTQVVGLRHPAPATRLPIPHKLR